MVQSCIALYNTCLMGFIAKEAKTNNGGTGQKKEIHALHCLLKTLETGKT